MKAVAAALARRIWPQWSTLDAQQQADLVTEVLITLVSLPLLLLSTAWLLFSTNWGQFPEQWPFLLLLAALGVIAGRVSYFFSFWPTCRHFLEF